jgi:hypothetical protein
LYASVHLPTVDGYEVAPPNAKAALCIPAPAKACLAVIIALFATHTQEGPFILSVAINNTLGLFIPNEEDIAKEKVFDNVLSLAATNEPELINAIRLI